MEQIEPIFLEQTLPQQEPTFWLLSSLEQNPLLIIILSIWVIFWKGWALWRAARQKNKIWFGVIFVFQTLGIIEILYLFLFSKKKSD